MSAIYLILAARYLWILAEDVMKDGKYGLCGFFVLLSFMFAGFSLINYTVLIFGGMK